VVARTPCGVLVDATRWKRTLIALAAARVAVGALAIALFPTFARVVVTQIAIGTADALFPPAIAALSLGLVGPKAFTSRVGRNEAFSHAGTALTALAAGVAGCLVEGSRRERVPVGPSMLPTLVTQRAGN
jgi:hypothetical protein